MIRLSLCCLLSGWLTSLYAQPGHDACERAVPVQAGETLYGQTNEGASISDLQVPAGTPVTCIQTFENDLWYELQPTEGINWYQIDIVPDMCTTPAGLQGMVISGPDCGAGSFEYLDCANPQSAGDLRLFACPRAEGGKTWIYIDGYDGTECSFSLSVRGFTTDPRTIEDLRLAEMDYSAVTASYAPQTAGVRFENNVAVVFWEEERKSSTALFQVQRCFPYNNQVAGTIIGTLEAVQTVGTNSSTYYELRDQRGFEEGIEYCYRIVRIDTRGARGYSEPFCEAATLIDDFWISEVFSSPLSASYQIQYNVRKKQTLRFILENEDGEELKSLLKRKEPKGDGVIRIDMSPYGTGRYALRVEGNTGTYYRTFFHQR